MRSIILSGLVCVLTAIAAPAQIIVAGGGAPIGIPDGASIWYGVGAPMNSIGASGDYYLDTGSYCLYGPKAAAAWPSTCVSSVRQLGYIAENVRNKGAPGGYAPLDANALVPAANLPSMVGINGTSVPGNGASDQTVVTTAPAVGAWTTLPACLDNGGNHLNYSQVTHGFLCGNTGGTVGSVTFGSVESGNNANGLLVSGTLSYTGGGQIDANQLAGVSLAGLPTGLLKITTGTGAPSVAGLSDVIGTLGFTPENLSNKGTAGGYAPLDGNGLLPAAQMPILSGDISNVGLATTVAKLQGHAVSNSAPADQQRLAWSASAGNWQPMNEPITSVFGRTGSVVAGTGDYIAAQVTNAVDSTGAYANPAWLTSLAWAKLTGVPALTSSVFGRSGTVTAQSGDYSFAQIGGSLSGDVSNSGAAITVIGLQSRPVASAAPTNGQVLTWNAAGSFWIPVTPAAAGGGIANPGGTPAANTALVADGNNSDRWATDTLLFSDGILSTYHDPSSTGHNVFFGSGAGNRSMTPAGGSAGLASFNVGIGYQALAGLTTGNQNIGIGELALAANTTGQQNAAVGNLAMASNTTGSYNTAIGENALGSNTSGYNNFAFGLRALYQNTTGYNNAAFGIDSVGINTTGYRNSGFGTDSCAWNVTGYENSCMGMNTLWSLTTGYDNTGTGFNAMFGVTSGHYLTGVGAYADMYYPNTSAGVTLTPTNSTSNLSVGWYWYKISYVLNGQETALSNNSYLGVLTDPEHQEVTITGIPNYSGPFVASARKLYRTVVCPETVCTVITANQSPRLWYYLATIGDNTTTSYVDTTADVNLGPEESNTPSDSIALGAYATVYGSYQMVVGSDTSPIQQIWLGNGIVTAAAPVGVLVSSSGASGSNAAGENLIVAGGPGTGTANGGNVVFGTAPGGPSGSVWNSLVNRWEIDSATGNLVSLSTGGIEGVVGTVDFSGGAHTLPAKAGTGAGKPSTCSVGEQYFATDATAGQNLFGCTSANTWTLEAGSSGGSGGSGGPVSSVFARTGAVGAQSGDYTLSQIASGTLSATGGTIYNPASTGNTQIVIQNSSSQAANGAGSIIWQSNAGSNMAFINWDGGYAEGDGTNYKISLDTGTATFSSDSVVVWHSSNNAFSGAADTGLARESAGGVVKITNGAAGYGTLDAGGLKINGTALATVASSGSYTDLINQPSLAGDVTGALGASTVGKLQNRAVAGTAPSDGQPLIWSAANSQWQPSALPDSALPSDVVTVTTLGNSTLTADFVAVTTTSDITAGGALTALGNVYANSGSNAPGCLHVSDTNGLHDTGICAPSSGFNGQFNLWTSAGSSGQVATTDGSLNLLWSNLSGIAGTLAAAQMPVLTGDIGNTGLTATVTGLQGRLISIAAPDDQQYLGWSAAASKWQPISLPTTQSATGGTIYNPAGTGNTQIVVKNSSSQATNGAGSILFQNNAGSNIAFINWDGGYATGDGTNYKISLDTETAGLSSDAMMVWHNANNVFAGAADVGLQRESAGIIRVTAGASGYGAIDSGGYSASGAAGVTSTTCTAWTNGLCTHN